MSLRGYFRHGHFAFPEAGRRGGGDGEQTGIGAATGGGMT